LIIFRLKHTVVPTSDQSKILEIIKSFPNQETATTIVSELQENGICVIDNFFPEFCVIPFLEEADQICKNQLNIAEKEGDMKDAFVIAPGPYLEAVINAISEKLLLELNSALKTHINQKNKTVYWHDIQDLVEFSGFDGKQLRLRTKGNLGVHIDRKSAKITVLIYLNKNCSGGELCAHLFPSEKKCDPTVLENIYGNAILRKKIPPQGNRFVAFWSDVVPHEICLMKSPRCSFQVFFSEKKV